MAASMAPPFNGELWHLSMDDMLAPFTDSFRLGGPGPFVINLRSSNTPLSPIPATLAGFEHLHLYQVQRMEDDVLRYRLRLGPFSSEEEADTVLLKVRDTYPCALTATAVEDDLQAIEQSGKTVAPPDVAPPVAASDAAPVAAPTTVVAPPATAVAAAVPPAPTPSFVSPPVQAPPQAQAPIETSAAQSLRWFVIELSVTEQAVDPDTIPNLDIYDLYRLYSVVEVDEGRRVHALRLGFFGEEIAAKAVASYLAGFYDKPTIKRVSVAERERFSQQSIEARKDVGATGKHAAIEITGDRLARPIRRPHTPTP